MTAVPRQAATVALLNNSDPFLKGEFQVLLLKRHPESSFVPSFHVYPGGALDDSDRDPRFADFYTGSLPDTTNVSASDQIPSADLLALRICAVRETFEEAGILLARHRDGSDILIDGNTWENHYSVKRERLIKGELAFIDILESEELVIHIDDLVYFSNWITPEFSPIRFDAKFFVALRPSGQELHTDGIEITDHMWETPRSALRLYEDNDLKLALPTIKTLETLRNYASVEAAMEGLSLTSSHIPGKG